MASFQMSSDVLYSRHVALRREVDIGGGREGRREGEREGGREERREEGK